MNRFFTKINKGFTLLETLVAILLFTIALAALLALVRDSVTSATYTKNEVVATYLAQEGVDYIRNIRDTMVHVNPQPPSPWVNFTDFLNLQGCSNSSGCSLDIYSATKLNSCLGVCTPMIISGKSFRRTINTTTSGTDAVLVKVEVTWVNGTTQRTKTLTTSLYNWSL